MGAASKLSVAEVRLIKAMLGLTPKLTMQAILAYFTRPGRDINHRVIAEIDANSRWPGEPPASILKTRAYMAAMEAIIRPDPDGFALNDVKDAQSWTLFLDWWPVGQGLFSSGAIIRRNAPPLTWVYDCGSASKDTILCDALDAYGHRQRSIGGKSIWLATLSHFDNDHISGFVRLIAGFPINTLLLPYVPLWQRLIIAIEQGIAADDPTFGFFLDPVSFLRAIDGGDIGEIVFVPSTGPEDPPPGAPEGPDVGPEDLGGDALKIEYGQPPPEAADDRAASADAVKAVRFLRKAGRIVVPLFWEFVPYNDAQMTQKATPAFLTAVAPLIDILRDDPPRRAKALKDLKALYDSHFGGSSTARNLISLFLYSGPLGRRIGLCRFLASHNVAFTGPTDRFCQMHTGDGMLDKGPRFDAFQRFYAPADRLGRSGIFQVMHHGARGNWHNGIAAALKPEVSLFSSDPAHNGFGHPHAEVLRDFWPYRATQIDRVEGFRFEGILGRH